MKSPGFDINDVGFMRRADQRNMSNWLQVRYERPTKWYRSFRYNLNQWAGWNFDGDRLNLGFNVNAHLMFLNNWGTGMGVNYNPQSFDDRATRGGPGAYREHQPQHVGVSRRRPAQAGVDERVRLRRHRPAGHARILDLSPNVNWRPTSFLSVSTGLAFSKNHDQSQWIEQVGRPLRLRRDRPAAPCRSGRA